MNINKQPHSFATLLRQFALQQIDMVLDYVTNPSHEPDVAIHETRRCLKRLRALLRLVKEVVGETIYDRDNRCFRDLGQRLAALRDAKMVQQTLEHLQQQSSATLSDETWQAISKKLVSRSQAQKKKRVLAVVAAELTMARSRVENWPLEMVGKRALRQALRKSYRQGRRAMKIALAQSPQAEPFHEWRKQVNHLRHQCHILRDLKIATAKKALKVSSALAGTLGLNQDLAVLSYSLLHLKPRETDLRPLEQLIQTRQTEFAEAANKLGRRLYRKSSKAFIKSISL